MASPAGGGGGIRLGGLTSGFDTEAIVEQLLARDQAKIDRLAEERDLNVAKVDTWEDVAEQLKSLATVAQTLRADGTTGNTLYDNKATTSSTATTATATATADAVEAEYGITVTTLARAHVAYGTQKTAGYTLPGGGNVIINGTTIALSAGDTLETIANTITNSAYSSGNEVVATVIDERLVLQTKDTGASVSIHGTAAGAPPFVNGTDDPANILQTELGIIDGGGNLVNVSQTAADASFSVNGIAVTRSSNTVTDVIEGVTLNLLTDGGATTNLTVTNDTTGVKDALTEFIDTYNETRSFLDRVRNAKLDENEQFGLFFSDRLMRELFNDARSLTTTGISMGDADWDGNKTVAAAAQGATSITINSFTNATGTLQVGDEFTIAGDDTVYKVQIQASIAANSATLFIDPPLAIATAGGEAVTLNMRSIEETGIGVRTDSVSGSAGILGMLDEGKLDGLLDSDMDLIKRMFTRNGDARTTSGVARRLFDWIDDQTQVSYLISKTRAIDDTKIEGLEDTNENLDEQIARLEARLQQRETALIQQFAEMENAMAQAQSAGSALSSLGGGGGG